MEFWLRRRNRRLGQILFGNVHRWKRKQKRRILLLILSLIIRWIKHIRRKIRFWVLTVKETPSGNKIHYICDFSRGVLNTRSNARIQHLLRGHKYSVFYSLRAVFGCWSNIRNLYFIIYKYFLDQSWIQYLMPNSFPLYFKKLT